MSSPRYAMVVDTKRCVGCHACVLACKSENEVPEGFCRDWIVEEVRGRFPDLTAEIRSERCNHCSHAPCVTNCPTGARKTQAPWPMSWSLLHPERNWCMPPTLRTQQIIVSG